jgi:hypothetical protein
MKLVSIRTGGDDDDDEIGIEIEITQKNHSSRIHSLNFTGH